MHGATTASFKATCLSDLQGYSACSFLAVVLGCLMTCCPPLQVHEEEMCLIPMGGVLPRHPQRTLGIGGTAGMVHPSTGAHPELHSCTKKAVQCPAGSHSVREHCLATPFRKWPAEVPRLHAGCGTLLLGASCCAKRYRAEAARPRYGPLAVTLGGPDHPDFHLLCRLHGGEDAGVGADHRGHDHRAAGGAVRQGQLRQGAQLAGALKLDSRISQAAQ